MNLCGMGRGDNPKRSYGMSNTMKKMKDLWQPIDELDDLYRTDVILCAPELVDLDCNVAGIGMGYYQDAPHGPGQWLAAKWNMTNDEWYETEVNPTHFIVMEGPAK